MDVIGILFVNLQIMAGLYVHIPFCRSKCAYCDFYSMPHRLNFAADYVDALLVEASERRGEIVDEPITTLYMGGGTPSLLPEELMEKLVTGLRTTFYLSAVEEFTIEVNPDDVNVDYILFLKSLGVNRVSMGVQSFIDRDLKFINRRHNAAQAIDAVEAINEGGIDNISIDLIYGIPGQSREDWKKNVEKAVLLKVKHISAYTLMYEHGTRLTTMRDLGKVKEVAEEHMAAMYDTLVRVMKSAGYLHYEISNFCKPGYHSRHNSGYWNLTPYLGLGVAAHSYDGVIRRSNPSNLNAYIRAMKAHESYAIEEVLSESERYDEYVMLRLRTAKGLNMASLRQLFPPKYAEYFAQKANPFLEQGMLFECEGRYFIPEHHVMVTDMITCELMWDD
ncbi:MAG: radical SAM family heme chaperone HemW [Sodaliphilus sp.]